MRPLGRETVTIQRATLVATGRGDALVRDWTNPVETVYKNCNVQPFILSEKFQAEDNKDREFARWTLRVWGPPDMDVEYTDRVVWRGTVYETVGLIQRWDHLMGPAHHTSFALLERTG